MNRKREGTGGGSGGEEEDPPQPPEEKGGDIKDGREKEDSNSSSNQQRGSKEDADAETYKAQADNDDMKETAIEGSDHGDDNVGSSSDRIRTNSSDEAVVEKTNNTSQAPYGLTAQASTGATSKAEENQEEKDKGNEEVDDNQDGNDNDNDNDNEGSYASSSNKGGSASASAAASGPTAPNEEDGRIRQKKNTRARMRAQNKKEYIEYLLQQKEDLSKQLTEAEETEIQKWERRRGKKNQRSRSRSLQRKERMDQILAKPEAERTQAEQHFVEEQISAKSRKNEGDRLRRQRLRLLVGARAYDPSDAAAGTASRAGKLKVTARGPLELPSGAVILPGQEARLALETNTQQLLQSTSFTSPLTSTSKQKNKRLKQETLRDASDAVAVAAGASPPRLEVYPLASPLLPFQYAPSQTHTVRAAREAAGYYYPSLSASSTPGRAAAAGGGAYPLQFSQYRYGGGGREEPYHYRMYEPPPPRTQPLPAPPTPLLAPFHEYPPPPPPRAFDYYHSHDQGGGSLPLRPPPPPPNYHQSQYSHYPLVGRGGAGGPPPPSYAPPPFPSSSRRRGEPPPDLPALRDPPS